MFYCCCIRLHRHQLHLISYGCTSFSLIATGIVFTVFAIFQKDSQIGKVWLAGPVLIVVGAVLCGKVLIDWGPAMARGRGGSIDSRLLDELTFSNLITVGGGGSITSSMNHLKAALPLDSKKSSMIKNQLSNFFNNNLSSPLMTEDQLKTHSASAVEDGLGKAGAIDCIVYVDPPDSTILAHTPNGDDVQIEEKFIDDLPNSNNCAFDSERKMSDKMTQVNTSQCRECSSRKSLPDGQSLNKDRGPKVIGKFVLGNNLIRPPSLLANNHNHVEAGGYGSIWNSEFPLTQTSRNADKSVDTNRSFRQKSYSQGETLILNERSLFI